MIYKPYWNKVFYPSRILSDFESSLKNRIKKSIAKPKCAKITSDLFPANKSNFKETLKQMKMLEKCQSNYMQVILTKIQRKSKPIKKHTKICDKSLKERKIDLEDEHFDLLQYVKDQAEI